MTGEQRILFGNSVGKIPIREHKPIWDNNIKMGFHNLKKMWGFGMVLFGSE